MERESVDDDDGNEEETTWLQASGFAGFPGGKTPLPGRSELSQKKEARRQLSPRLPPAVDRTPREISLLLISEMMSVLLPEFFPSPKDLFDDFVEMTELVFLPLWEEAQQQQSDQAAAKHFVTSLHNYALHQLGRKWGSGQGIQAGHQAINAFLLLEPQRAAECICICSGLFLAFALWWVDMFPHTISFVITINMFMGAGHIVLMDVSSKEIFETTRSDLCLWGWEPANPANRSPFQTLEFVARQPEEAVLAVITNSLLNLPDAKNADFIRRFVLLSPEPGVESLEALMRRLDYGSFDNWTRYLSFTVNRLALLPSDEALAWLQRNESAVCPYLGAYLKPHWGYSAFYDLWVLTTVWQMLSAFSRYGVNSPHSREVLDCLSQQLFVDFPQRVQRLELAKILPPFRLSEGQWIALIPRFKEDFDKISLLFSQFRLAVPGDERGVATAAIAKGLKDAVAKFAREAMAQDPQWRSAMWLRLMGLPLPSEDLNRVREGMDHESWAEGYLFLLKSTSTPFDPVNPVTEFWEEFFLRGIWNHLTKMKPAPWHQVVYLMALTPALMATMKPWPKEMAWFRNLLIDMKSREEGTPDDPTNLLWDLNIPWQFFFDRQALAEWTRRLEELERMPDTPKKREIKDYLVKVILPDLLLETALPALRDGMAESSSAETVKNFLVAYANLLTSAERWDLASAIRDQMAEMSHQQNFTFESLAPLLAEANLLL